MTGKELKELASNVNDDAEILVEVEDFPEGINLRRKFNLHAIRVVVKRQEQP